MSSLDPADANRPMTKCGSWYPSNNDLLKLLCEKRSHAANQNIRAIIVPHAGIKYSGKTAAAAFQNIATEKAVKILLIAPSHYTPLRNIVVSTFSTLSTPFGDLKVAKEDCDKLLGNPEYFKQLKHEYDAAEHALEMQLFQVKHALPNCQIIPLLVGRMENETRKAAAEILKSLDSDLIIVSSDFSHYGINYDYDPFGNVTDIDSKLRSMDQDAFKAIQNGQSELFERYLQKTGNTVCGKDPIKLALDILSKKNGKWEMLAYDRSSISTSFEESSVGYMAAAYIAE